MPPLEYMDFHSNLVLWSYISTDRQGDPTVAPPIQLPCRWEEGQLEIPSDPKGNFITVDSVIATIQDLVINSIVWEGKLTDLPTPTINLVYLYEVVVKTRAFDLKGRWNRYEFGLRRYKDKLPKIVSS